MDSNTQPCVDLPAEYGVLPPAKYNRLKIFISSICGNEKYDQIRAQLRETLEKTLLADVYTFETSGASFDAAQENYVNF